MNDNEKSQGGMKEWYQVFINTLKRLSEHKGTTPGKMGNKDFAAVGSTDESKRLIEELCNEIDEEYDFRIELETERVPEAWFEKKINETMDDLHEAGIIDKPTPDDYVEAHKTLQESIRKSIVEEAEQTAIELNVDTDELAEVEQREFYSREEV